MTNSTTDNAAPAAPPEQPREKPAAPPETPEAQRRGKRYQRFRMMLSAADWTVEFALLNAIVLFGWSVELRQWAERATANPWLAVALYLAPLGVLFGAVSMAFSAIRTFVLDRRFGLSTQTFAGWLLDGIKGFLVGGALGLMAVEILYGLLRWAPETWWLWAAAVFSLLTILIAQLAPVLIFPIFFKFKKLINEEIVNRLKALAERAGTKITGVYEMNLSKKTRAANAALAGFGRTRRIILADTLLDRFTLDEIESIMAHELAHHARRHLQKGIALQTAMYFLLFFGVHQVLRLVGPRLGFEAIADVANFPLIALTATVLGLILLPITNAVMRGFEREADDYAMRTASRPEAFISALRRLAQLNLADSSPNPVIEWIFYSHPSIKNRIRRAEEALAGQSPKPAHGPLWWGGPVAVWVSLILLATSAPGPMLPPAPFTNFDLLVHTTIYGGLGFLLYRALFWGSRWGGRRRLWLIAFLGAAAFGIFDELHQAWIPGRDPALSDAIADAFGALLGVAAFRLLLRFYWRTRLSRL